MKIAFDAKRAFHNSSGLGNYSRTVIRQLCEYYPENEYVLYSPKKGGIDPDFPPENSRIILPEKLQTIFNSYWRSYGITKNLRKETPDVFHGLSNELPVNIHQTGIPAVVTIHDLIFMRFPSLYKAIDRKIYRLKFKYASERADLVIAASKQTKEDLVNFFNIPEEKIRVVYQSGDPSFSRIESKEKIKSTLKKYNIPEDYILNVGTIEERKNLLQLVKAFQILKEKVPLVIAGRPKKEYTGKVRDYIRKNDLKNIFFLQEVPSSDLPSLYQGARVFVYPSSFEGFGIPVLEAVQSGIPVIAGSGHCLEETGGPESIYIDPFNIDEFSSAIENVLDNSELRSRMKEAGIIHAQNFHPEKTIRNLYEVYESL